MYDKYFQANPITIGSKLPKHKGILISGGAAGVTMSVQFVTASGSTLTSILTVNNTPFILNMQLYALNALPTGLTAFYVN
jgi:hypothetical protein